MRKKKLGTTSLNPPHFPSQYSVSLSLGGFLISFPYLSLPIFCSPLTSFFHPPNPPSPSPMSLPISPDRFAYLNRSRSVLAQHKAKANPPLPLPFPQPPHSPKGGDRALPSDYTVGEGLDYSPEGRQLSISDNCRERDTHACVCTHPPFLTLLLLR